MIGYHQYVLFGTLFDYADNRYNSSTDSDDNTITNIAFCLVSQISISDNNIPLLYCHTYDVPKTLLCFDCRTLVTAGSIVFTIFQNR